MLRSFKEPVHDGAAGLLLGVVASSARTSRCERLSRRNGDRDSLDGARTLGVDADIVERSLGDALSSVSGAS